LKEYEHLLVIIKSPYRDRVTEKKKPVRRQRRGLERYESVLDAAAGVFAEVGFERATTNAIAAQAEISPGSLYQYFSDKEDIARALAARYVEDLTASHRGVFASDFAALADLDAVVAAILDPIIDFNVRNPAFLVLFARSDLPPVLAAAVQPIEDELWGRIAQIMANRNPALPARSSVESTRVAVRIFHAVVGGIAAETAARRRAIATDAKLAVTAYLRAKGIA
jgi:AcrR family transcriptional regulator